MRFRLFGMAVSACLGLACSANAAVVFSNFQNNGYFTPFSSTSASTLRYGDDGYFGSGSSAPVALTSITLGLTNAGSTFAGTTDVSFHLTDGEAFGTNTLLYSTTITNFALPATTVAVPSNNLTLTLPLPNVATLGGFNNIGFDIAVSNYNSDGTFGFQCALGSAQTAGFYTNNAYDSTDGGAHFSFFSFGAGTSGVANFVQTVSTPEPASLSMLAVAGLGLNRRRRD